ncbi:galactose mutarotase-like domain-containing protein [Mycena floridula]|nr:galactose mutarotase-like domain-containing protein [Mycena floridula]
MASIQLKHRQGSTVDILLYGATIISWKSPSKRDAEPIERLFLSSKAMLSGEKPVRGGIPVVFPCFGAPPKASKLSQHGFARSSVWNWDGEIIEANNTVTVTLTLSPTEAIRSIYSRPFHLAYVVTLSHDSLSTELQVSNSSTSTDFPPDALIFQALLHNYIAAPAIDAIVTPLKGLNYYDKTEATEEARNKPKIEMRNGVDVRNFTDSIYENAPPKVEVTWPGGGIAIETTGLKDLVIWNPQAEATKIKDLDSADNFICCEPGFVRGFQSINPGHIWKGKQVLSVIHEERRITQL